MKTEKPMSIIATLQKRLPTKIDFDEATKQDWNAETCLVAQFMRKHGLEVDTATNTSDFKNPFGFAERYGLRDCQIIFDRFFNAKGDEKLFPELKALRKSLPRFNWPWQKLIYCILFAFLICNVAIAKDPRTTKDVVVPINDAYRVAEADLPMNFNPENQTRLKVKFHSGITIQRHKK